MTNKIAFCGPIYSGKTRTAVELRNQIGGTKLAFGDLVKQELSYAVGKDSIECAQIYKEMQTPELKYKWRSGLQVWGTDIRRNLFGKNYWVDKLEETIDHNLNLFPNVCLMVDDCRFQNEYDMLKNKEFVFIKCLPKQGNTELTALHESEQHWQGFSCDIILPWMPIEERVTLLLKELNDL